MNLRTKKNKVSDEAATKTRPPLSKRTRAQPFIKKPPQYEFQDINVKKTNLKGKKGEDTDKTATQPKYLRSKRSKSQHCESEDEENAVNLKVSENGKNEAKPKSSLPKKLKKKEGGNKNKVLEENRVESRIKNLPLPGAKHKEISVLNLRRTKRLTSVKKLKVTETKYYENGGNDKGNIEISLSLKKGNNNDKDKTNYKPNVHFSVKNTTHRVEGKNINKKRTKIHEDEVIKSKPTTILKTRTRKFVNYAESSLEASQDEPKNKPLTKVPIYNQPIEEEKPTKRKGDLYEFDSDSEKQKKKRRKREDSTVDEYEKKIKRVLKNIKKRIQNKKKETKGEAQVLENDKNEKCQVGKPAEAQMLKSDKNKNCQVGKQAKVPIVLLERLPLEENEVPEGDYHSQDNSDSSNEELFGFDENENVETSKIQLKPTNELNISVASPSIFKNGRPNANSTMVFHPWRFSNVNLKRNPYFINLKESALPSLDQEMVLDHTLVEKLEGPEKTLERTIERPKTPIQKTLDSYFFPNEHEDKENVNITQSSLFDSDQLSPIKNKSAFHNKVETPKRKVLGEKNDNIMEPKQTSTPMPLLRKSPRKQPNDFTNFGFSSVDEETDKENAVTKDAAKKPFRFSMNINDKKYKRKRKVRIVETPVEKLPHSDTENSVDSDLSDVENHNREIKLFEDFEEIRDPIEESRIIKKKKKINDNKHKKRKDVMSKEEEEQFEKWASAFNSMCEEVEKFSLEIE